MSHVIDQKTGKTWTAYHGDTCQILPLLPAESADFGIWSPPFGDLFMYSDYVEDMSNCASQEEFFEQYEFVVREMFRLVKPGRLIAVHCSDLPTKKWRDGYLAVYNFSDKISELHQRIGWYLHSRITIWKSPVGEMQRTKALGLLYKQLRKDSSQSRVGMSDYLMVFRKPGVNTEPITHADTDITLDMWQKWASPVWMDINQGNVLNVRIAKEGDDEKHLCPLQLDLIERAIRLWSNKGDVVLSPFMGIGSEGYESIRLGRKFIGIELKDSYFGQAARYLAEADATSSGGSLLDMMGAA